MKKNHSFFTNNLCSTKWMRMLLMSFMLLLSSSLYATTFYIQGDSWLKLSNSNTTMTESSNIYSYTFTSENTGEGKWFKIFKDGSGDSNMLCYSGSDKNVPLNTTRSCTIGGSYTEFKMSVEKGVIYTITVTYTSNANVIKLKITAIEPIVITPNKEAPYYLKDEITLTATGGKGGVGDYQWYKKEPSESSYTQISGENNASYSFTLDGSYTYKVVDTTTGVESIIEIKPSVRCDEDNTKVIFSEDFGWLDIKERAESEYAKYTYKGACTSIKNGGEYAIVAVPVWGGCNAIGGDDYGDPCWCPAYSSQSGINMWFNEKLDHATEEKYINSLKTENSLITDDEIQTKLVTFRKDFATGTYDFRKTHTAAPAQAKDNNKLYGGMLLFNCKGGSDDILYERKIDVCDNTYINFSAWFTKANVSNADNIGAKFVLLNGSTRGELDSYIVENIDVNAGWKQVSAMFNSKNCGGSVIVQLINYAPAGDNGNDLLVDDISLSICTPEASLHADYAGRQTDNVQAMIGEEINLISEIDNVIFSGSPFYWWQKKEVGSAKWTPLTETPIQNNETYNETCKVKVSDKKTEYRVIVANSEKAAKDAADNLNSDDLCGLYSVTNSVLVEPILLTLTSRKESESICSDDDNTLTLTVENTYSVAINDVYAQVIIPDGLKAYKYGTETAFDGTWKVGNLVANTGEAELKITLKPTNAVTTITPYVIKSYISAIGTNFSWTKYDDAVIINEISFTVKPVPAKPTFFSEKKVYKECALTGSDTKVYFNTLIQGTGLKVYSNKELTNAVEYFAGATPTNKTYYANLTVDGCTGDTVQFPVTVHELPKIVSVTTEKLTICNGTSPEVEIKIDGGVGKYEVQMEKKEASSSDLITIPNIGKSGESGTSYKYPVTPTMDTKYVFKSVKDANECSSTSDIELDFDVQKITDTPTATDFYSCPVGGTYSILDNITSDKKNLIIYKSSTGDEKISEYVDLTNSGTSNKEYLFYVSNTEDEKCESLRKEIKATVYVKPTANISGNTTICKGQSTDLKVALFGTKDYTITYTEKVGNKTTDKLLENVDTDNKTISVSPTTTTTYALKEVIDENSCKATLKGNVEVLVNDKAEISISTPEPICAGDPLDLTNKVTIVTNGSTVTNGKWYLDGEEYNGADLVYKDEAYTLQYKANSSCGGETKSNEVTFKVKDKPTINLTEVDLGELCAGTELNLPTVTTKENNSTISSQGWLLGTSSITSPINSLSTDVHDGKTITYTATNECGTTKVDYTTLSVKECADFTLTFDLNNSNPCSEDEVTLTATITNKGDSDLSNVVLSLQGPNAQASVTSSTSGDIVSNYSAGVWTIPTFTSKATATLTIKFSAQASEELKIHVSESNGVLYASYAESPAKDTEELVVKEISDDVEISDNYIMCPTESSSTMFLSDFVISNQDGLKYFDKNADGTYTALTSEPTFDPSLEFASHTYYITNTETGKCESTTPTPITIEIYKPVKASISGLSPLCSGETSNVNITLEGTPEFTVVYNNGTADITQKTSETTLNIAESLSSTTTYKLVSVTDSKTCPAYLKGTEFVTIQVNPRPELASFEIEDTDDIICEGTSTNLKANFKGTPDFKFTLQTTKAVDGVTKTETTDYTINDSEWSMEISEAGQYKITKLLDKYCESATLTDAELTLTVEGLPELTLSATDVTLNCTTPTATITASGASTYEWSYLDQTGATQTKSGATLALQQTDPDVSSLVTEYTVYGYSKNANCKSEEAKTVKVTEDFVKPVVDIKISETADGTIPERLDCYQQNIKLEADLTNNKETIVEYIWSSGSDNNTTLINNPGTYTLQVKGENGCISDVATETIEQNIVKPEVSIESYITDPVTGNIIPTVELTCANNEITLEGTITNADQYAEDYPNGEFTYLWSDGATTSSTVAKTPLATSPMEYTLIVTSPNGCLNEVDKAKVTVTENVSAPVLNIESVYKLCPSDTLSVKALSSLLPKTAGVTYKFYDEAGVEIDDFYGASSENPVSTYYVVGTSENGCSSEKVAFDVDFAKNVDFTLTTSQTSMLVGGNETLVTIVPNEDSEVADTYTWLSNGKDIPVEGLEYSANLYLDTKFEVTATNRCDTDTQEASVEVLWPTAFTPHNGNGKNDDFAKGMHIIVFNRFYTKIFEGPDGWDGTINGAMNESESIAVPGVYYYSVQLPNGEVKKGTIEIVKVD